MPHHHQIQILPYTTRQLFDLVADVQSYPEFLPWCRAARILKREEHEFLGELIISFKGFTESYVSRVILTPPVGSGIAAINVELVSGPFENLSNRWVFTPESNGHTKIEFDLDFKFRSTLLDKLIGGLFARASETMVEAFRKRAAALYS
jgi:coenzyme Q-binding protein COQ10